MGLIEKLAASFWKANVKTLADLLKAAIKSFYLAPAFYGITWLVDRHAPTHDMWFGFAFAACMYTSTRRRNERPNKEDTRPPSPPIILPASKWSK